MREELVKAIDNYSQNYRKFYGELTVAINNNEFTLRLVKYRQSLLIFTLVNIISPFAHLIHIL